MSHGAPIGCLGPAAACVAAVEADHCLPNTEVFAAEAVVMLGIVARITKGCVDPDERCGLPHGRGEVRRVLARASAGHRAENEVRVGMDYGGEFRPSALAMSLAAAQNRR